MKLRNCSIALGEMLGGVSLLILLWATFSLCAGGFAQAQDSGAGAPATTYVTSSDTGADGNVDVPAPAADYDVPADSEPYADRDTGAVTDGGGRVLELPQVLNPADYDAAAATADDAAAEAASANPGDASPSADPSDSAAALAAAEAALIDANAALADSGGSGADDDSADAASGPPMGDAQDYANQPDSGALVVYAAPVYLAPMPSAPAAATSSGTAASINNGELPMYSALYANRLPMYSALMPAGPGRYQYGTGTRLFNSRLGQGFFAAHSMAIGGFGHAR
ncbi:MAG: hypothetical protein ABSG46_02760 [Candidatus Binataceae bacterium]|jgi:hypothetical protein